MSANASSSWPTATSVMTNGAGSSGRNGGMNLQTAADSWPTPTPPTGGKTLPPDATPTGTLPDGTKRTVGLDQMARQWPTATGKDADGSRSYAEDGTPIRSHPGPTLTDAAQLLWKTPSAQEPGVEHRTLINKDGSIWTGGERAYDAETGRLVQTGLPQMVKAWGTPRASDAEKGGPNQKFGAGGMPLPAQAAQWPTPAARDHKGENGTDHLTNGTGRLHMDQLPNAVAHGFTRPDLPTWTDGATPSPSRRGSRLLLRSATSSISPAKVRSWSKAARWRKRRLSPAFVEWLMGWPTGHALCACLGMGFTHWQQEMRGALSQLPTDSGPWIWEPPPETAEAEQLALF
nr:hypothetical protein [Paracoccus litorisediminis]